MNTLYLDCFSGISGDMTIAALLGAGLDFSLLEHELRKLGLTGYHLHAEKGMDGSLAGTRFHVHLESPPASHAHEHSHEHDHDHAHTHDHDHDHAHTHDHDHDHAHTHEHAHTHDYDHEHPHSHEHAHTHEHAHAHEHSHHHWADIRSLIESSTLSTGVKGRALAIFSALAEAEGRVHGIPAEDVAFHEVGAIDSIVDIVGVAIGLEALDIQEVYCSELPLSHGHVVCQHGLLPLPAPATLELLKGFPVYDSGRRGELITPTGAAILKALVRKGGEYPRMNLQTIGYGLGQRRGGATPNVLRALVGQARAPLGGSEPRSVHPGQQVPSALAQTGHTEQKDSPDTTCWQLELNIDDMNPQLFPPLMEQLLTEGALDVTLAPVLMKKGRPGHVLQVLCTGAKRETLAALAMRSSSSIGTRYWPVERTCLERRLEAVATRYGTIRVKVSGVDGKTWQATPEFEDCAILARTHGISIKQVYLEALRSTLDTFPPHQESD